MRESTWRRYLRFWRPNIAADIDDELRFHFDERMEALVAGGMTRDDARRAAEEEFGDAKVVRRGLREIDRRVHAHRARAERWAKWRQDIGYSARSLRRSPGLSLTIVVTLALGLGANATLFSLLDRVFLRMPSGIVRPQEVRRLYWASQGQNDAGTIGIPQFSIPLADAVRDALRGVATVAIYQQDSKPFDGHTDANSVVTFAGANYFSLLGVHAAYGRLFTPEEERIESTVPVAVVSDVFWRRHFGGSPAEAIGQTIQVGQQRLTVVGVAPKDFTGPDLSATDLWVPLGMLALLSPMGDTGEATPWYRVKYLYGFQLLARPAPTAADRLQPAATLGVERGFAGDPQFRKPRALTGPLLAARGPEALGQESSISLRLGGVALIILLITCANVTNLLLARSIQRRREVAIRVSLGVSRSAIVRLFLAESVLLACAAGVSALIVASWTGTLLRRLLFPNVNWSASVFDWQIAAFTILLTVLAGIGAGIIPALRASSDDVADTLRSGVREGGARRSRTRAALVVAQAALSTVLLFGAVLFVKSLRAIRSLDLGYDVQQLVFVSPSFDRGDRKTHEAALQAGVPELESRLSRVPGVERVALANMPPMYGFSFAAIFYANGDSLPKWTDGVPGVTHVSPDYFATIGLPLLRGRGFTAGDAKTGNVAVVNQTFARNAWPHDEAIGQCVRVNGPTKPCLTIIGIVGDARRDELLEKPVRQLYEPSTSADGAAGWVIVRVPPNRAGGVDLAARRAVTTLFPGADATVIKMADLLAPRYRPWELGAILFTVFGLLALVVAAMGVFSALSHDVSQRRHELGVRAALGATIKDIVMLVIGSGVRVVAIGAVAGCALAIAGGRLVASLLYGVTPSDPMLLSLVTVVLLGVAMAAAAIPAWRASRADPMDALRSD
jgi:putative ABC transport system permease protein